MANLQSSFFPPSGSLLADAEDAESETFSLSERIKDANQLAEDFHTLYVGYEALLRRVGLSDNIEQMAGWAKCYAQGLEAGHKLADGTAALAEMKTRLNGTGEDLARLESEGGCPAKPGSSDVPTQDFTGAIHEIGAIVSRIEHMFGQPEQEHLMRPASFGYPGKGNKDPAYPSSPSPTESNQ